MNDMSRSDLAQSLAADAAEFLTEAKKKKAKKKATRRDRKRAQVARKKKKASEKKIEPHLRPDTPEERQKKFKKDLEKAREGGRRTKVSAGDIVTFQRLTGDPKKSASTAYREMRLPEVAGLNAAYFGDRSMGAKGWNARIDEWEKRRVQEVKDERVIYSILSEVNNAPRGVLIRTAARMGVPDKDDVKSAIWRLAVKGIIGAVGGSGVIRHARTAVDSVNLDHYKVRESLIKGFFKMLGTKVEFFIKKGAAPPKSLRPSQIWGDKDLYRIVGKDLESIGAWFATNADRRDEPELKKAISDARKERRAVFGLLKGKKKISAEEEALKEKADKEFTKALERQAKANERIASDKMNMMAVWFDELGKRIKEGKISSNRLRQVMKVLRSKLNAVLNPIDPVTKKRSGYVSARDLMQIEDPPELDPPR